MIDTDPTLTDDSMLALYIGQFAARDDLYVSNAAEVIREPLSPKVIRRAVAHHYAISGYMATEDGRTHVGALDFDREDGRELALSIAALLHEYAIPSLIVGSRRGAHLWVTAWDRLPAGIMHRALRSAAVLTNSALGDDPRTEVFPKRADGLGAGALRLPGMPHQRTQQRYPIWTWDGVLLEEGLEALLTAHEVADPSAIKRIAGAGPPDAQYPNRLDGFYGYHPPRNWDDNPSACAVLASWGVPNARPGTTVRCPKHEDRRRSLTIFKDDQRVYCGSPICPLHGGGHGVGSVLLGRM